MTTRVQRDSAGGQKAEWVLRAGIVALLVALAAFLLVRDLGASSFWSSDEALYAQVAREMMRSLDPLGLRYQGERV